MRIPKVSIIVPVYNTEKYLKDCIDSILSQSFTDFEVILINDGSTDRSSLICEEFALKDSRITLFHKENGGVSTARNLGLKHAKGEWVYFVDADDSLVPDCLTHLMEVPNDIDIIQFGYNRISNKLNELRVPSVTSVYGSADVFSKLNSFKVMTLWIHLIRRSLVDVNNIYFTEGLKYAEDLEFVIKCYACAGKIKSISSTGYNYYEREGSAMARAFTFENAKIHLTVAQRLIDFFYKNNLSTDEFFQSRVEYMIKSYFSYSLNIIENAFDKKEFKFVFESFLFKNRNIGTLNNILGRGVLKVVLINPLIYLNLMKLRKIFKI